MDFEYYYVHAVKLAHGLGYVTSYGHPTAYWPIGYPLFLSLVFRLTGPSVLAGLLANAVLSILTVCLIYWLTQRLTKQRNIAIAAALGYTLLPSQIEWNAVLGSEELFTFLALLSLLIYVYAEGRSAWFLASGILAGFASTVRPVLLLFPVALFVMEWLFFKRPFGESVRRLLWLVFGLVAAVAPVTIRNFITMHHLILISTNGGVNLWQGTHANGSYYWPNDPKTNPLLAMQTNEIAKNQLAMHLALQHILHHPIATIGNGLIKLFDLYWVDWNVVSVTFAVSSPSTWFVMAAMWGDTIVYWLWMVVAVTGLVSWLRYYAHWRRHAPWLLVLAAYIVYNSLLFLFFPAWDRFRYPIMPVWSVFFGIGWLVMVRLVSKKAEHQAVAGA